MWILTNTTQRFVQHNRDGNASPRWKKKPGSTHQRDGQICFFKPHVILCSELVGGTPFEFLIPSCPIWLFFLDIIIISHPPIIFAIPTYFWAVPTTLVFVW